MPAQKITLRQFHVWKQSKSFEKLLVVGSDDDAWDSIEQQMSATQTDTYASSANPSSDSFKCEMA
jgi:hypothetical protein